MNWLSKHRAGQVLLFIILYLLISNLIKAWIFGFFGSHSLNGISYRFIDLGVMLSLSVPLFWWMMNRMDSYIEGIKELANEKQVMNEQLEKQNQQLKYMAYYDDLTHLPNQYKLIKDLRMYLEHVKQLELADTEEDAPLGFVGLLDIKHFQKIHEMMGQRVAERLKIDITERLKDSIPKGLSLYNYSDHGFALVSDFTAPIADETWIEETLQRIKVPFKTTEGSVFVSLNMGITIFPEQGEDAEELLTQASQALAAAKREESSTYLLYNPILSEQALRKLTLEQDLQTAVERNELRLYYQAKKDLQQSGIIGAEALIRWEHPEHGFISPCEFIPIAESSGMIIPIGEWVLETACKQLKEWQDASYDMTVSVNVSIRQLRECHFPDKVRACLWRHGLSPDCLELEITESLMQDLEESKRIFRKLKEIGVKISVDDFGTGYASLSVLSMLDIDYLKIDQAFVRQMGTNEAVNSIVKTIIQLGKNINVALIAEGIEERHQEETLLAYGCEYGQGYLYSKPIPATAFRKLLEADNPQASIS